MFWQEEDDHVNDTTAAQQVDVAFEIVKGQVLPWDHAYLLSQAIQGHLPWFARTAGAALHLIRVAEANGWQKPTENEGVFYLSRRTRLMLRVPTEHLAAAHALTGQRLEIGEYSLSIGQGQVRPLKPFPVLIAHHVLAPVDQDESDFIAESVAQLRHLHIHCRKVLCGKQHQWQSPEYPLLTRSLMVADLNREDSLRLQQHGLGIAQHLGFGVFVPHKDIQAVSKSNAEEM
ncbi:type I-MYXAN CRISPR-associated protein Cas6/Cmx6 [Thioflexithrix psekupsensis]|uniref:Type I-MYXAN CRISPR-associated protein Cas6/Cmx6 n=1 Tax=Thioflexithrix psekupsensis TaxID=1570016 RepID=A0A251X5L2_9GAMM|nr:type I-MYXAN CRISPR-associated protein Cas6/Cmx6 [Thioflexithrix psekupsensis]OUD12489.1 type I-MYXAN CRISPR-associated protein Cas6/Cmx6 [Thioflexithrix psekupsensis]